MVSAFQHLVAYFHHNGSPLRQMSFHTVVCYTVSVGLVVFPTSKTTSSTFSNLKLKWVNVNLKGVDQANFNMPMCIGHTQLLGVFLVYINVIFFLCLFFPLLHLCCNTWKLNQTFIKNSGTLILPSQALPSAVGMKPMSQSQRKPPGMFRQWPFSHRLLFSAHSSLSAVAITNTHLLYMYKGSFHTRNALWDVV